MMAKSTLYPDIFKKAKYEIAMPDGSHAWDQTLRE
jgi:hypothetical protein